MKIREFIEFLKNLKDRGGNPICYSLYADLADEVATVEEKHPGMVAHLNVEGVFRNGLEVSAEAHAVVAGQRAASKQWLAGVDERAAEAAAALSMRYTVRVPGVPVAMRTEWHPTTDTGPFATLDRGAFKTPEEAIKWARDHLNGTPYTLVKI